MSEAPHRELRLGVVSDFHHTRNPAQPLAYHGDFELTGVLDRTRAALRWGPVLAPARETFRFVHDGAWRREGAPGPV